MLYKIREEGLPKSSLLFWDELLSRNGDFIAAKRQEVIDWANSSNVLRDRKFEIEYDKSAISQQRLEKYRDMEIASATTLVGPHRDDFSVFAIEPTGEKRLLSHFGSRGEQRIAILWLKLRELSFIENQTQV